MAISRLGDGTHTAQSCPGTPSGDTSVTHDAAGENTGTSGNTNTYDADQRATTLHGVTQDYLDHGNDVRTQSGTGSTLISYISGPLGVTARTTTSGTTFYTRSPSGDLLDEHGTGGTQYFLTNYQGSVMALVSASGTAFNGSYVYGPYGETTVNAQSGGSTAANNPWQYAGGYHDTLEGDSYYHFGARYYSPGDGRWTQSDPKPGSINQPRSLLTYGYAGDDPTNNGDSNGRDFTGFFGPAGDLFGLVYDEETGDTEGAFYSSIGIGVGALVTGFCTAVSGADGFLTEPGCFVAGGFAAGVATTEAERFDLANHI